MKIDFRSRATNGVFWFTLLCAVLSAVGLSPEMFTSWDIVWQEIVNLVSNPFRLGLAVVAIYGVINNPTVKGLGDGK